MKGVQSTMNCPIQNEETAELLLAYTARRLDASKTAMLESHMDVCPECAEFRAGQEMVWQALDAWVAPPVTPDFNRRLYQRIEAEAAEPWYKRLFTSPWSMWKPAIPLAAACLLVVAGFVLDHPVASNPSANAPAIRVGVAEAEQVESALDDLQLLRQLDSSAGPAASESM
jgi:anti-sigma factor RsiW